MMSDNNNQESIMDDSMSVSQVPGQGYALHSGAVALQIPPRSLGLPLVQYPVDDTMPVKAWVFEVQPSDKRRYKPFRPEDERKAIEAINRHLPPSERIEIIQPSHTGSEVALNPRARPNSETFHTRPEQNSQSIPRRYHGTHLPVPPRSRDHQDEAARPPRSHKNIIPAQVTGKEMVRRAESMNWDETENQEKELAWRAQLEGYGPAPIVPNLMVTRPDGRARYLQDPTLYNHGKERGNISYFW